MVYFCVVYFFVNDISWIELHVCVNIHFHIPFIHILVLCEMVMWNSSHFFCMSCWFAPASINQCYKEHNICDWFTMAIFDFLLSMPKQKAVKKKKRETHNRDQRSRRRRQWLKICVFQVFNYNYDMFDWFVCQLILICDAWTIVMPTLRLSFTQIIDKLRHRCTLQIFEFLIKCR